MKKIVLAVLALVLSASPLNAVPQHARHKSTSECRITWQSLITGKTGHGVWLPSNTFNWQVLGDLNKRQPAINHDMECRPIPTKKTEGK